MQSCLDGHSRGIHRKLIIALRSLSLNVVLIISINRPLDRIRMKVSPHVTVGGNVILLGVGKDKDIRYM